MPKHRDALLRHWAMLRLIPRAPRMIATREVHEKLRAQGYEIDVRTVQRDLRNLSAAFPYSCTESSGPEGALWFWTEAAAALDLPGMEVPEALAFVMSRSHLETVLPADTMHWLKPQMERAEQVLSAQNANRLASWKKRVRVLARGPRLAVPAVDRAIQSVIYEAVLRGRQVFARYRGRNSEEARETKLHPFGLVVKDGLIYLIASEWSYTEPHHNALHRFAHAELLQDTARVPKQFDLDRYIDEEQAFGYPLGKAPLALRLSVEEGVAQHPAERPLAQSQKIGEPVEGRVVVEAEVADTAELRRWLLGFGADAEVLGPPALRAELAERTAAAALRYAARTPRRARIQSQA